MLKGLLLSITLLVLVVGCSTPRSKTNDTKIEKTTIHDIWWEEVQFNYYQGMHNGGHK